MKKRYWKTPSHLMAISDAAELLANVWGKARQPEEIKRFHDMIQADWENETITQAKHGRIRSILVRELKNYYPKSAKGSENEENQLKTFKKEVETIVSLYEKQIINDKQAVEGIKKLMNA
jgi:hypothetical protein